MIFTLMFLLCFCLTTFAQSKHSRVIELEKTLSREGLELLKGRFPEKPFLLSVKIDPLMRERPGSRVESEKLPYYDLSEEEVIDEWDDPSVTNSALLNRVKNIFVNVSIPSDLTDDEIAELKATLINNLGMIEARDKVEVSKRNWGTLDRSSQLNWQNIALGGLAWAFIMVGLFFLLWYATSKLGKTLKDSGQNQASNNSSTPPQSLTPPEVTDKKPTSSSTGDLRFNDPIKNRETLAAGIRILESHTSFPNLGDMMILHKFSEEKPADLGALLSELPIEMRVKVFSYSFGPTWLEALIDPGEVTSSCVETLNKCLRQQRNDSDTEWQTLLISVWRLNEKRKDFFRGMNQNEALAILYSLPKSIALEIGREAFPGAWGLLLDPQYQVTMIPKEQVKLHIERATTLEPYRNFKLLNKYRNEKELLIFLKNTDPSTEKEIYQVAGEDSMVWSIRPPFYKIFELSTEQYDRLVPIFRIEDWSLAMFNISRSERKEIEKRFSDKQRFRYFEILKSFDGNPPSKSKIGDVREKIAKTIDVIIKQQPETAVQEISPNSEEPVEQKNAA